MAKIPYDRDLAKQFIKDHFNDYIVTSRGGGHEWEMMCPFCKGGRKEEVSFNINLRRGVAQCWRAAKCGWTGSFVFFVKNYLDCGWATAYKIAGGEAPADIDELIGFLNKINVNIDKETFVFREPEVYAWVENAIPIGESESYGDVLTWLEWDRGYDPILFADMHELYVTPYSGYYEDRAIFRITTNDRVAFLAYAMKPMERKTLNPTGEILSNMFYNYDGVQEASTVFLVEGIFDAARLMSYDFPAIASFGLRVSSEQIFLLAELSAAEIVICFDNGCDHIAQDLIKKIAPFMKDKTISYMSIKQKDADPDDLSEEEFLKAYINRSRYLVSDQDRINNLLLGI